MAVSSPVLQRPRLEIGEDAENCIEHFLASIVPITYYNLFKLVRGFATIPVGARPTMSKEKAGI